MDYSEDARLRRCSGIVTLIAVALFITVAFGLIGMLLHRCRPLGARPVAIDLQTFSMGLAAYRRDFGSYPPDDIASVGGSAEHGTSEVIHYYLGREQRVGGNLYGPYVDFKEKQLSDKDADGFEECRDPWGSLYVYAQRTPAPGAPDTETPPRPYDIASPGPDGKLGGRMVPGKGYVPATTHEGKAAEADNITNW